MATERRAYRITGLVQGVGYRYYAQHEAASRKLKGWVCNRVDGSVEVQVEGKRGELDAFESVLRRGPRGGQVDDLERIGADERDGFQDFEIRFG